MITQIKSNPSLSFKNNMEAASVSEPKMQNYAESDKQDSYDAFVESEKAPEKEGVVSKLGKAKKSVTKFAKKMNTFFNVSAGAARGLAEGAGAAALVGLVGKNIQKAKGQIGGTISGIAKDVWSAVKFVPSILYKAVTKSPIENLKSLKNACVNGAKCVAGGFKKYGKTAAVAAVVGAGVLTFRIIQGRIKANDKNAAIDHKTHQGHHE